MGKISIDFKTGNLKASKQFIIGIDLGTTNSLVAFIDNHIPKILPLGSQGSGLVPSVIYFDEEQILIGEDAKQKMIQNPENGFYSIKRLMGKSFEEFQEKQLYVPYFKHAFNDHDTLRFKINNFTYSPTELSSIILKQIKFKAEQFLNAQITQAVITVPAYFSDSQRQATRDAGELAGIEVLRIINEPTAASMAYGIGLNTDEIKQVMVYDLGGGTFDVSILRIEQGIFEVLATHGNNFLGGDDIDYEILIYWKNKYNIDPHSKENNTLRFIAEDAKRQLKTQNKFEFQFNNTLLSLTSDEMDQIAGPIINKTISSCKQALKDSGLALDSIDEIILVGGSSRLNLVKASLISTFNRPVNDYLNPDEVVAIGAAIQADILSGNRKDLLLLDVTPLSLGIETVGGLMDTILPRNSKIPLQLARQYTTSKDGQNKLKISVFQGERDLVKDNLKLAEFVLHNLPSMAAGLPKIEISFRIDADGILSVSAKELRSGIHQSIEIKSPNKLNEEDIAQRLKDSIKFSEEDIKNRSLIEIKNEAEYIIRNAQKFLLQNKDHLTQEEFQIVKHSINEIEQQLIEPQKVLIEASITQFNIKTSEIAHRIMDLQLKKSLSGNSIDAIES